MNLIEQEVSTQRWIDIPAEVLDISTVGDLRRFGERCTSNVF